MTTNKNEIVITESAMQKVLANDETLRLKCIIETLYEQINQLNQQLANCNGSCKKEKKNAR